MCGCGVCVNMSLGGFGEFGNLGVGGLGFGVFGVLDWVFSGFESETFHISTRFLSEDRRDLGCVSSFQWAARVRK